MFSSVALASEDIEHAFATKQFNTAEQVEHSSEEPDLEESDVEFAQTEQQEEVLQIGSGFERTFLKPGDESSLPTQLKIAALSSAEFGTGSAFYVGEFGGRHIMATNAHVMMAFSEDIGWSATDYNLNAEEACKIFPGEADSEPKYVRFSLIDKEFDCKRLVGLWPEIDFALFEIEMVNDVELQGLGISLKDYKDFSKGQTLSMFSYGVHNNPGSFDFDLAHTQGETCKIFSDEARKLQKSDNSEVAVWSMATGCDLSVGDSGSAMVDSETGLFTGVIWAGAADKTGFIKDDAHLEKVLTLKVDDEEMVWSQMNYAVPAAKLRLVILESLKSKTLEESELLASIFN